MSLTHSNFRLVPCEPDGFPIERDLTLPDFARQACEMSAAWYGKVGYVRPWMGYIAVMDGSVVGGGGFKEPPQDRRVEIAYFTVPEFEGRGHATRTARVLVAIAKQVDPTLTDCSADAAGRECFDLNPPQARIPVAWQCPSSGRRRSMGLDACRNTLTPTPRSQPAST
jgi:hypothetical protein